MSAKDEVEKARLRGQPLGPKEVELEELREKLHSGKASDKELREFKKLSAKVADVRTKDRVNRELEGPPTPANPGDAVVRIGQTPSLGGGS